METKKAHEVAKIRYVTDQVTTAKTLLERGQLDESGSQSGAIIASLKLRSTAARASALRASLCASSPGGQGFLLRARPCRPWRVRCQPVIRKRGPGPSRVIRHT